jgi:hypothetical protein
MDKMTFLIFCYNVGDACSWHSALKGHGKYAVSMQWL